MSIINPRSGPITGPFSVNILSMMERFPALNWFRLGETR